MTTHPRPKPSNLAVMPVVDYEPPVRPAAQHRLPAPVRLRCGRAARPLPEHLSRVVRPPRDAAAFADAALRRVLEVIDRRRPATQLYPLLAAGLVDSILSALPIGPGPAGAATLQRVRLQPVESACPATALEVSGSYRRGRRTHALACRIERVPAAVGPGWQVVALHIG